MGRPEPRSTYAILEPSTSACDFCQPMGEVIVDLCFGSSGPWVIGSSPVRTTEYRTPLLQKGHRSLPGVSAAHALDVAVSLGVESFSEGQPIAVVEVLLYTRQRHRGGGGESLGDLADAGWKVLGVKDPADQPQHHT